MTKTHDMTGRPDRCQDHDAAINDLVDGAHGGEPIGALGAHLASCASCRSTLAELRAVRDAARALDRYEPPPRLWSAIAARVSQPQPSLGASPGRIMPAWQPLAAAAALVCAVSGQWWVATRLTGPASPMAQPAERVAPVQETARGVDEDLQLTEARYADAIATLESAMDAARPSGDAGSLGAQTVGILETSIADLDDAIGESRLALATEPTNELARASLLEALDQKVALLHDTVDVIEILREDAGAGGSATP